MPALSEFGAEEVPDGATEFKCCPPIRDAANREGLWAGLAEGLIGTVVSDHSPCPPGLKQREAGDFGAAWGGISSLQLGLPAVWTQARRRGHGLADVVRWMAEGPPRWPGCRTRARSPWAGTPTWWRSCPARVHRGSRPAVSTGIR